MSELLEKETKVVDNTRWRERHQFVLSANGNIICQRYFRVNGFNSAALHSEELCYIFRDVVDLIKNDLASKTRVYEAITKGKKTKLTGFLDSYEGLDYTDAILVLSDKYDGNVELSNGKVVEKSYMEYESGFDDENDDEPFVFKFSYLFDDKVVYEEQWDGTVYPKYIRNSVDLSNSNASYRNTDPMRMTFSQQMKKYLTDGREDLIYIIIQMLSKTLSNDVGEDGKSIEKEYTSDVYYSDKKYYYSAYPVDVVKGWANAVRQKTIRYKRWVENDYSKQMVDFINSHL